VEDGDTSTEIILGRSRTRSAHFGVTLCRFKFSATMSRARERCALFRLWEVSCMTFRMIKMSEKYWERHSRGILMFSDVPKRYTYVSTFARESVIRSVILRNTSRCKMAEIRVGDFTRTKSFSWNVKYF